MLDFEGGGNDENEDLLLWTSPSSESGSGKNNKGIDIIVPQLTPDLVPCQHAWVFALTGLANDIGGISHDTTILFYV
eukprot:14650186-Ditylum_brightwellii.AAC.1